jgi:hypothetical protein
MSSVKSVTNPVTGQQFKLGRKRPTTPHGRPYMREMLREKVLPNIKAPTVTAYSPKAAASLHNIYGNDVLGDCVIAGGFHVRGIASFNSGKGVLFSQDDVIKDYGAIGGYDPSQTQPDGSNPTDQGCDENTALSYWQKTGFPDGVKLVGSIAVDPTNIEEVRLAMYLFENLYFGVELPDAWVNPMPASRNFVWRKEGAPDQNNGHCFIACDLSPDGVKIDTWGMTGWLTNDALAYYASADQGGQLFALLTPDIVSRVTQKSPAGFNIATLSAYLKQF